MNRHDKESSGSSDGRWSVEQRLEFVEERLYWLGAINRQHLIDRFGVSISQASADINKYLKIAGPGVAYDKSAKRYVAGTDFNPVLAKPDAGRLLAEIRFVDAGLIDSTQTRLGSVPPVETTPVPERTVDPEVLRVIWRAIARNLQMTVQYQSMSRTGPAQRTIEPHALAHDGFRWHARAWDELSGDYRDFVIGRISTPRLGAAATHSSEADSEWNDRVQLLIAPHPDLPPAQREAVRLDYGIAGEHAVLEVRRALLFYALKRLGLDTPPEARKPQEQHIVLLNRDEVMGGIASREPE